jgi:phage terminase small subunit
MSEQKKENRKLSDWTVEELREECTDSQLAFIEEYFINGFNATKAYLDCFETDNYGTAKREGCRILTYPHISELIKRRLDEQSLIAAEVLARLTAIARGNIGDFLKMNKAGQVEISLTKAQEFGLTHLIKKIKQRKTTETKANGEREVNIETTLELYSSADALDKLARVHGLYKDSMHLEIEGTVGVLRTGEPMDMDEWLDGMEAMRNKITERSRTNGHQE